MQIDKIKEKMRQEIITNIDNIVDSYNQKISETLNIDKKILDKIWKGEEVSPTEDVVTETETKAEEKKNEEVKTDSGLDEKKLKKLKKPELKEMCKEKGLKLTGTKSDLIGRLLNGKPQEAKKKSTKTKKKETVPVVKKLQENLSVMVIRRNAFGNLEHSESSMIFDRKTKKVIGKQNKNGNIDELTVADIDICNKYKFDYNLPENLDLNSGLDDVAVEELEEELVEEEEEIVEESEEELVEEEEEIVEGDDDSDEELVEEEEEYEEYEEIVEYE